MVIDPCVLVAAPLSGREAPAELIRRWLAGQIDIIMSPLLLDELSDVFARAKFRQWLTIDEAERFVDLLRSHATLVDDPPPEHGLTPDSDDDYLVSLARTARAQVLVSGDADLVNLEQPLPPVRTARRLLELLDDAERR